MANPVDDGGNVQVDFVWGNIPMQPDDARGENVLDPDLDNHIIAAEGWSGYPSYIPNFEGDGDDTPNVTVPNVVGLDLTDAGAAFEAAGLAIGTVSETITGATEANNLLVKTQSVAAGSLANQNDEIDLVLYILPVTVPDVAGLTEVAAAAEIVDAGLSIGAVTTSADGATAENDGLVKSQTPAAGASVAPASDVNIVLYAFAG